MARDADKHLAAFVDFAQAPSHLDLTLQPALTLSGSVKDPKGAPITNAIARFEDVVMPSFLEILSNNVDVQANFSFPTILPQASLYRVEVTAEGYGRSYSVLGRGPPTSNFFAPQSFVLKRADRRLSGQVLMADGQPAMGATMIFGGGGQPRWDEFTQLQTADGEGRFALEGVCDGPISVSARLDGYSSGRADAHGGDSNVVVRLGARQEGSWVMGEASAFRAMRRTIGTIHDPSGEGAPGVGVWIFSPGNRVFYARSDAAGRYDIVWQEPRTDVPSADSGTWLMASDPQRNLASAQDSAAM